MGTALRGWAGISVAVLACTSTPAPSGKVGDAARDAAIGPSDAAADARLDGPPDARVAERLDARLPDAGTPGDAAGADAGDASPGELPGRMWTYRPTDDLLLNPERGFYRFVVITEPDDLRWVREEDPPATLAFSYVRLDDWRDDDLPAGLLDSLERGLRSARAAGLGVILRFAYNDGPYPDSEPDASLDQVLRHIEQVTPALRANADVIALVQAGFIGAWGEWHTSTHGLDTLEGEQIILESLLAALPPEIPTQVRYPFAKMALYGASPLAPDEAFGPTPRARVGHHNDCFLSSEDDVGTYWIDTDRYPPDRYPFSPADLERFVEADTAWVPFGGETCDVHRPKQDCPAALAAMARVHATYLNADYHPDVMALWRAQGCLPEIQRRLGYRFALVEATFPDRARPGDRFRAEVRLRNDGFAAPFAARPVFLVLDGPRRLEFAIDADVRRWWGGAEHTLAPVVRLPDDLPAGRYSVSLWLPDRSLRDEPTRAIRLDGAVPPAGPRAENGLGEIQVDP